MPGFLSASPNAFPTAAAIGASKGRENEKDGRIPGSFVKLALVKFVS